MLCVSIVLLLVFQADVLRLLAENGANMDSRNALGETPFGKFLKKIDAFWQSFSHGFILLDKTMAETAKMH